LPQWKLTCRNDMPVPEATQRVGAAIAKQLDDSDWQVRQAALSVLRWSPRTVVQHGRAIAKRVEDSEWRVCMFALAALIESFSAEMVAQHSAAIAKRIEDSDDSLGGCIISRDAIYALRKSPEAVAQHGAAIAKMLKSSDASVREAAELALKGVGVPPPPSPPPPTPPPSTRDPMWFDAKDKGEYAIVDAGGARCMGKPGGGSWSAACGEPIDFEFEGHVAVKVTEGERVSFGVMPSTACREESPGVQEGIGLTRGGQLWVDGKVVRTLNGFGIGDPVGASVLFEGDDTRVVAFFAKGKEVIRQWLPDGEYRFAVGSYGNRAAFEMVDAAAAAAEQENGEASTSKAEAAGSSNIATAEECVTIVHESSAADRNQALSDSAIDVEDVTSRRFRKRPVRFEPVEPNSSSSLDRSSKRKAQGEEHTPKPGRDVSPAGDTVADGEVTMAESSERPKRTHRNVLVKQENANDGLIRCPKCSSGIQAGERGCNLVVCRGPHDGNGWFYFCFHCRQELLGGMPCMRQTCPERNDRESRATAKRLRNEDARLNPIMLSSDEDDD